MDKQGHGRGLRVEKWLSSGGVVVTANERSARSVSAAFHAARQTEGRSAWRTPAIISWDGWVRERWMERNRLGLMLLNTLQEEAVWSRVIRASRSGEGLLHPRRLAAAAQRAHRLICQYAPEALGGTRSGWQGDAATFSEWLGEFDHRCGREGLVSANRLALDLTEKLRKEPEDAGNLLLNPGDARRNPLLLIGFDRLLPTQIELLDEWGEWARDEMGDSAVSAEFYAADDVASEVRACVRWLRRQIEADPDARLMVIATGLDARRGELERALLSSEGDRDTDCAALDFEFSLGVPLGRVGLARCAVLLLRWLHESILEPELDWLIGCGYLAESAEEEVALCATMRKLRDKGQERPEWRLGEFAACAGDSRNCVESRLATAWASRLTAAQGHLHKTAPRQSPLEWARLAGELLETAGWPGFRPASSMTFQARRRWEAVLEECGSLGFDGSHMGWAEFVEAVSGAVAETIFAAESTDAPIQITEPLESGGQLADGIWFLGADEESWPGRGQPHPLLPIGLQRDTGMPHANPQSDWTVAQETTLRLLASADEVNFSYSRRGTEADARPSRLVVQLVGAAKDAPPLADWRRQDADHEPLTESFEDLGLIPFLNAVIEGGAATLTRQSLCPFQAFATTRLGALDWEQAETGLNARQRGQLVHDVLHRVWAGRANRGLSNLADLEGVPNLPEFVEGIVRSVLRETFGAGSDAAERPKIWRRFPVRYLDLERKRLTRLVSEWLEYERRRLPFTVAETEVKQEISIAGGTMRVRLDRVDVLEDGSRLIIDYKSSDVGPRAWSGDRPDDVQLPLYATFAEQDLQGLVFARVRPGKVEFCGRVRDAKGTLIAGLGGQNGLVKDPLTSEQLALWKEQIERLGEDFLQGRADVDPKGAGKPCQNCHLHSVCRIYENQPLAMEADGDEGADADEDDSGGGDG